MEEKRIMNSYLGPYIPVENKSPLSSTSSQNFQLLNSYKSNNKKSWSWSSYYLVPISSIIPLFVFIMILLFLFIFLMNKIHKLELTINDIGSGGYLVCFVFSYNYFLWIVGLRLRGPSISNNIH